MKCFEIKSSDDAGKHNLLWILSEYGMQYPKDNRFVIKPHWAEERGGGGGSWWWGGKGGGKGEGGGRGVSYYKLLCKFGDQEILWFVVVAGGAMFYSLERGEGEEEMDLERDLLQLIGAKHEGIGYKYIALEIEGDSAYLSLMTVKRTHGVVSGRAGLRLIYRFCWACGVKRIGLYDASHVVCEDGDLPLFFTYMLKYGITWYRRVAIEEGFKPVPVAEHLSSELAKCVSFILEQKCEFFIKLGKKRKVGVKAGKDVLAAKDLTVREILEDGERMCKVLVFIYNVCSQFY
ncbi:MAG: hypothetical protein EBQ92_12890, partial [Proteobacteria bacterium]|nr:hypothetical protein [Pseudomonadota bacterium]